MLGLLVTAGVDASPFCNGQMTASGAGGFKPRAGPDIDESIVL